MVVASGERRTGRFWVDGSDEAVEGVLIVRDRMPPRVELLGELTPAWRSLEEVDDADGSWQSMVPSDDGPGVESLVIHGELATSPRRVTLVDCFTYHRRFQLFGGGASEHFLQARYALIGERLSRSDLSFGAVRIELENLASWANLTGFTIAGRIGDTSSSGWTIKDRLFPRCAC